MIFKDQINTNVNSNQLKHKNTTEQSTNYYHHHPINSNHISPDTCIFQKFSSPRLSKQLAKKHSPPKISLPIKEFHYGTKTPQTKKYAKSQSKLTNNQLFKQNAKLDRIPIKIIKDKLQHQHNINIKSSLNSSPNKNHWMTARQSTQNQQNPEGFLKSSKKDFHNFLSIQNFTLTAIATQFKERQKAFRPKLSIFERYNYENYENYSYKNPYHLHQAHSIISRNQQSSKYNFPTTEKYQPHKGSQKNLQIIFCEKKYPQFVQKTNQAYQKFNENKSQRITKEQFMSKNHPWSLVEKRNSKSMKKGKQIITNPIIIDAKNLMNTKNTVLWNHDPINPQKINCVHTHSKILNNQNLNSKSTLEKLLKEFKTLEKLTLLQQKQQQTLTFNRLRTENLNGDHSKTVLISLLSQKFPFLQNLSKSLRNNIFRSVFEEEAINQGSKISIYDFLKLSRIFVSKDASLQEFSVFLIRFLFKSSMNPSIEVAERTITQLNPNNKQKLQSFIEFLYSFGNGIQIRYETIITKFIQNPQWMITAIELIKNE